MEKNKYTLITIVVLLVIVLPAAIYGTFIHYKTTTNFKKQFKFNGKLYFYSNNKLLGTYTCKTKDCDYASYLDESKSSIINNNYAFIYDNETINLVNIKAGDVIEQYDAIASGIDNIYFVIKDDKWGAIEIINAPVTKISIDKEYNYLEYRSDKFIARSGINNIITDGEKDLFSTTYPISDLNDNYIVLNDINNYNSVLIYDYNNNAHYISYQPIEKAMLINEYILIKKNNEYTLLSYKDNQDIYISNFYYDGTETLTYEFLDNNIIFRDTQGFEQIIELNVANEVQE